MLYGVPAGINVKISTHDDTEDLKSRLSYYDQLFGCYDIEFTYGDSELNGIDVQPAASIDIVVPLNIKYSSIEKGLLFAYHYFGDSFESLNTEVDEASNNVKFSLSHFSRIELFGPVVEDDTGSILPEEPVYDATIAPDLTIADSEGIYMELPAEDSSYKNSNQIFGDNLDEDPVAETVSVDEGLQDSESLFDESKNTNNTNSKSNTATNQAVDDSQSSNQSKAYLALCFLAILCFLGGLAVYLRNRRPRRVKF
jgi:hypothetical protein